MKKLLSIIACLLVSVTMMMAQKVVTGRVISGEDGEPIIGASVVATGTTNGTVTDSDGNFSVNVPESAKTLTVSYVGMESQTVNITGKTLLVTLSPNNEVLDEVMVVAFGTAKKSAFTGSAAVVSTEDLSKHVTSNVTNALVGSVPGLQIRGASGAPGAGSGSIQIRGIASMYADTDPLVIVDGAPYSASLTNIPPGDIESVTVLKDAASAALYGARGAAGVILVTTKKGSELKPQINVEAKWGVNSRAIQEYDIIKDPGQHYEAYYAQLYNMYYYGQGLSAQDANLKANSKMLSDLVYNVYTYPETEQLIGLDGKLNPHATLGRKYTATNGTNYWLQPDNWTDEAYGNALRQEYTVSMNAGNSKGHFYTSINYLNEDGIIEYSGYERVAARLKADYQMNKWFKISANVSYTNSKTESNPNMDTSLGSTNLMYYTTNMAPIYPIYIRTLDENGLPQIMKDQYGNPAYDYGVANSTTIGYYGLQRTFLSTGNPLGNNRYNDNTVKGQQFNGTFTADITLTSWLKASVVSNVNWGLSRTSTYDNALYGPKVGVNGEVYKGDSHALRTNNTQTLNFVKAFGKHNVTALAGHEYYKVENSYLTATANGGFSPDIQEINAFANKYTSSSYTTAYNNEGYFGSAQYNYDEKYFLSASFRRDASSRFAKENRWGTFWSVGGAWIITNENFMESTSTWLNQLKLKVSIGQQGNDNIGNWAYVNLYSISPNATNTGMNPSFYRIGNKDITWETTTNFNAGVEFALFNRRLNGSVDVYNKKTTDLLFWLSIPESAGSRGYYGNIGDIRNSGVEVSLSGSILRTRNFEWNASVNFSHNSDEILKLPESKIADNGGFTEDSKWFKEGGPLYNMFYRESGIDEQGKVFFYQDSDLGGATNRPGKKRDAITYDPNTATKYEMGSILPKMFGGFSTDVKWRGLDASVTFDFQIGGKVYDSRYAGYMSPAGNAAEGSAIHKDYLKAWSPNNTESNIPRWQYDDLYTTSASTRFWTNASYLNFQSFTVGYTLPKLSFLKDISRIRFYAAGENLYFWSARKGLDPRYSFTGNTTVAVYSPTRNITGGVQITF